jgi:hypothetical protein
LKSSAILVFVSDMKKPVLFDIVYKGEILHHGVSPEKCTEIMEDYALKFYESVSEGKEDLDYSLLTLEETRYDDERRHLCAGQTKENSPRELKEYSIGSDLSEQR